MERINQKKTVEYLKQLYPEIKNEISTISEGNNFTGIIQTTVDQLKKLLEQSKIQSVILNVKRTDWIYNRGNFYSLLKLLITFDLIIRSLEYNSHHRRRRKNQNLAFQNYQSGRFRCFSGF